MSGISLRKEGAGDHWLFREFYELLTKNKKANKGIMYVAFLVFGVSAFFYAAVVLLGGYHGLPGPFVHSLHDIYTTQRIADHGTSNIDGKFFSNSNSGGKIFSIFVIFIFLTGIASAITRKSFQPALFSAILSSFVYLVPHVLLFVAENHENSPSSLQTTKFVKRPKITYASRLIAASKIASLANNNQLTKHQHQLLLSDIAWIAAHPRQLVTYHSDNLQVHVSEGLLVYRLSLVLPVNERSAAVQAYLHHYDLAKAAVATIDIDMKYVGGLGMLLGATIFGAYAVRRRSVNQAHRILQNN